MAIPEGGPPPRAGQCHYSDAGHLPSAGSRCHQRGHQHIAAEAVRCHDGKVSSELLAIFTVVFLFFFYLFIFLLFFLFNVSAHFIPYNTGQLKRTKTKLCRTELANNLVAVAISKLLCSYLVISFSCMGFLEWIVESVQQ